ncbi:hypothetical protein MASR2M78_17370 [Treponema sp.]
MKRFIAAFVVATLAVSAFADDDGDSVMKEARKRAKSAQPDQGVVEQEEEKQDQLDEDTIFLPVAFSVLPGSPIAGMKVDTNFGLGLIIGSMNNVSGLQVSSIASISSGRISGLQAAYVFNIAQDEVRGIQTSNAFNIAGEDVKGIQGAGVFNIASGKVFGIQSGGIFNIAQNLTGIQASGIFNVSQNISGIQAAGIFNVTQELHGIQLGLVNIAETANGMQLGLINIVEDGIHDLGVWFEDSGDAYGFWQNGTKHAYTILFAGAPRNDWCNTNERLAGGIGFGFRIGGNHRFEPGIDIDLSAKARFEKEMINQAVDTDTRYHPDIFPSARLSLRLPLGSMLAIHAGAVLDIEREGGVRVPEYFREKDSWDVSVFGEAWTVHPKWFIGFSL